jgi:hypothetical protein
MYLSLSELQQLDLLMKKKPAERFLLMAQLIGEQIEAMKAGIKYKNPKIDNEELHKCMKSRMREIYSWKH